MRHMGSGTVSLSLRLRTSQRLQVHDFLLEIICNRWKDLASQLQARSLTSHSQDSFHQSKPLDLYRSHV